MSSALLFSQKAFLDLDVVTSLIKAHSFDVEVSEKSADSLYKAGIFISACELYHLDGSNEYIQQKFFEQALAKRAIPLPMILKMVKIVSSGAIQNCDELKSII